MWPLAVSWLTSVPTNKTNLQPLLRWLWYLHETTEERPFFYKCCHIGLEQSFPTWRSGQDCLRDKKKKCFCYTKSCLFFRSVSQFFCFFSSEILDTFTFSGPLISLIGFLLNSVKFPDPLACSEPGTLGVPGQLPVFFQLNNLTRKKHLLLNCSWQMSTQKP